MLARLKASASGRKALRAGCSGKPMERENRGSKICKESLRKQEATAWEEAS